MARIRNTNYQGGDAGSDFYKATEDTDPYSREQDTYGPAVALDGHDHTAGRGLPVGRLLAGIVDTDELAAGAVTGEKIATDTIDQTHMKANSIGADQLKTDSVGADEIVAGAVGTLEIADDAVLLTKLGHGAANRIFGTDASGVPSLLQLAAAMVPNLLLTGAMMAASTITEANVAANTLTDASIATGTVHANRIRTDSFDLNQATIAFADESINGSLLLLAGSVTEPKLEIDGVPGVGKYLGFNGTRMEWYTLPAYTIPYVAFLVAAVPSAGFIGTGWSRDTSLDGRMMVYDGTTFGVSFTAGSSYGTSWSHLHGVTGTHSHGMAAAGISGNTGSPSGTNTTGSTGNTSADGSHTHNQGSLDVTGSSDAASSGNTDNAAWTIPCKAYVPVIHS